MPTRRRSLPKAPLLACSKNPLGRMGVVVNSMLREGRKPMVGQSVELGSLASNPVSGVSPPELSW